MPTAKKKWKVVDHNGETDEFEAERVVKEGRSVTFYDGDELVADYTAYSKIVPIK